jgi:hypothetical protein
MLSCLRAAVPAAAMLLAAGLGCMLQSAGESDDDQSGAGTDSRSDGGRDAGDVARPRDDGREDAAGDVAFDGDAPTADVDGSPDDDAAEDDAAGADGTADDDGLEDDGGEDRRAETCPPGEPEICNGLDDDCNGAVDDGLECALGTVSTCGPCALGRKTCTASCTWSECVLPPEVCSPGTVVTCTPSACAIGHATCPPSCSWGPCVADHSDCSPGTTRGCSLPSCGSGTQTCGSDCAWGGCAGTCPPGHTCCPGEGCFDLDWHDDHCGDCATSCGFLSICWDGRCTWARAGAGLPPRRSRAYSRRVFRRIARGTGRIMADYARSGYEIAGVVGIQGSPTCGVHQTIDVSRGVEYLASVTVETLEREALPREAVRAALQPGSGAFFECLRNEMRRHGIEAPFFEDDVVVQVERGEPRAIDLGLGG